MQRLLLFNIMSLGLFEDRQKNIEYIEKQTKGEVSKVIANLTKQKSSAATKLATRYKQIDSAQKKITEQRNTLNLEMTEYVSSLFDAEDAIYTRVVDTASMILTLSKAQKGTKISVNFEKILEEILKIVPELTSQVDSLLKKYTVIKEFEKKAALRTPKLKGEGVLDKIIKKFKDFMLKFRNNIISWGKSYDKKLTRIKGMI